MKVGILTYHRAENYGALLQAYALRTYLQSLGHDVDFVDYWPDYHNDYFRLFSKKRFFDAGIKGKLFQLYYLFFFGGIRKQRKKNLQEFMYKHLGLSEKPKYRTNEDVCDEFDMVFYGSDQIWRKQGMKSFPGYDFWYWGADNVKAKKIAYAASMGTMNVTDADKECIISYLKHFDTISVRENSLKGLLDSLLISSELVVDPVFLLGTDEWTKLIAKTQLAEKGYILLYNLLGNEDTVHFAKEMAKERNLKVIEITKKYVPFATGGRYNYTAGVKEFLSLIYHADYVVSNSFHGVAFSIIFQKQFLAIGMGSKHSRVTSLLNQLNLNDRYIIDKEGNMSPIEYEGVIPLLQKAINSSKSYIENSIKL